MIVARFGGMDYILLNRPKVTTSSRETFFSLVEIDFTGKSIENLPIKYQEIKIVDTSLVPEKIGLNVIVVYVPSNVELPLTTNLSNGLPKVDIMYVT